MKEKQYELRVNGTQLAVIQDALESYFRVRTGQFFDLAEDVAFAGFDYKEHDEIDLNSRIARRDAAINLMNAAHRLMQPMFASKTSEMLVAQDIWSVIRHERWKERPDKDKLQWTVDATEPLNVSGQPRIVVRRVSDDSEGGATDGS